MQLPEHHWVRDDAGLAALAERVAAVAQVALDSESNSMFAYHERVCLMQLNVAGELFLVDTLALGAGPEGPSAATLGPLAARLADPKLRVWVHGGEYDVACFKRDFDLALTNLFDTQQAASFLGWPRTGYAAVVEELCGIKLAKDHSQYDWGRRPIDAAALSYALDDVIHLPEVGAQLEQAIRAAGLDEELDLANATVAESDAHDNRFDPARMWRLKGIKELRKDRLGLLSALYTWRDAKGLELDHPPGRLIANAPLLALAAKAPKDRAALRRLRLRGSFVREYGDELLALIDGALREPPEVPSRPRKPRPSAAEANRTKALKAWRREEAERREVPVHVVLPPRALDWIAANGVEELDGCPELGAKRAERYRATLREVLG